jgi:hypothetical protein
VKSYSIANNKKSMKKIIGIIICACIWFGSNAQDIIGAWEAIHTSENGAKLKSVLILSDGYQVISTYDLDSGEFISSNGGTWKLIGDTMTEKVEFNTEDSESVGDEVSFEVFVTDSVMGIVGSDMKLKRIDNGMPGILNGAWLMSGRKRGGEIQLRDTNRPRKTMKILSGTRFQWIAYNTETKEFMATGGGTYTTIDGVYTENIEFFSRDASRVGKSLKFDFNLKEGKWHHSGFSSKGDPMYEIWSVR